MYDNGPMPWDLDRKRGRRADEYLYADVGVDTARLLRVVTLVSIATRLLLIFACAKRISLAHNVLSMLDASGRTNLSGDGAADLVAQAQGADALVGLALVLTGIVLLIFVVALVMLGRRRRRGDAVATAIHKSRAVRLAGPGYVVVAIGSVIVTNALRPGAGASPVDRLHALLHGDTATIGIQFAVVVILLLITLVTHREIARARVAGPAEPASQPPSWPHRGISR
jgi:hypothetical protein